MTAAYEALAQRVGATVCPVGALWWQVAQSHPEEELYFADGEHSSVLGASLAGAIIGRTLLGMELAPETCYQDAKVLEALPLNPRMIDLTVVDGSWTLPPWGRVFGTKERAVRKEPDYPFYFFTNREPPCLKLEIDKILRVIPLAVRAKRRMDTISRK